MTRKRGSGHSSPFRLPRDFSGRFEDSFRDLVDSLCEDGGFMANYLRDEVFSKYLDEKAVPSKVRRAAAITKWLQAEAKNEVTNRRLMFAWDADFGWVTYERLRKRIRSIIQSILGPLVVERVLSNSTFTSGASTRVRRSPAARVLKVSGEIHISNSAIPWWMLMASGTMLTSIPLRVVNESVLFTVPKKTEIDRVACKEPEGNMLLQRSVGLYIRSRLRRVGIDLRDQSVNQSLAAVSVLRGLATIDLSSASDTITRQLVQELLPTDWCDLLDDLRVKCTVIDGAPHELSMFSSMGNGFTFELESLLFYSIARAVCWESGIKGRISVYGDDIIAPVAVVRRLRRVFSFFGFTMNPKKTHASGFFRESCGYHYWKGLDVSPFYIQKAISTIPELINTLNHLLEWDGRGYGFFTDRRCYTFWLYWRRFVPRFLWGGVSPEDPSALVTGHLPRKRLAPVMIEEEVPEDARLTTWHLDADRSDIPIGSVDVMEAFEWRVISHDGGLQGRTSWSPGIAFQD